MRVDIKSNLNEAYEQCGSAKGIGTINLIGIF